MVFELRVRTDRHTHRQRDPNASASQMAGGRGEGKERDEQPEGQVDGSRKGGMEMGRREQDGGRKEGCGKECSHQCAMTEGEM